MPNPAPAPSAPRPSAWRWPKRIAGVLVALLVVAYFVGPSIIAGYARPRIEQAVADNVNGRAEIDSLSISWGGAVAIQGLKIVPPGDSAVLEVPSLTAQVSVRDVLDGRIVAKAVVEKPIVRVRREPDGRTNVDRLREKKSGTETAPAAPADPPLPTVRLDLQIKGGTILFEDGAQSSRIEGLDCTIDLPALDQAGRFEASFTVAGGGSGKLISRLTLARDGKLDPTGSVEYALDAPALERLQTAVALFSDVEKLAGNLQAKGSYTLGRWPEISGSDEWTLQGLRVEGPAFGGDPLAFPEIRLRNKVAINAQRIGKADLTLVSGSAIDAVGTVTFSESDTVDAVFKLASDLNALGQAVRGILRMKEGVSLAGVMTADGTLKSVGPKGTLQADLLIDGLAAVDAGGKKTPIEKKVALKCDVAFDRTASSADVRNFTIDSSPIQASAKGQVGKDAVRGTYTATADLDLLADRLGAFMDLGDTALAGRLDADGEATSQGDDVRIKSRAIARGLQVGNAGPINLESHTDATLRLGDAFAVDGSQKTTVADFAYAGRVIRDVLVEARYKQVGEKIETFTVTAPGLKLMGNGSAKKFAGTIDLDPGPFHRSIGILFGDFGVDGKPLKGDFSVTRAGGREVRLAVRSPEIVLGGKSHTDLALDVDALVGDIVDLRRVHIVTSNVTADVSGAIRDGKTDLKLVCDGDLGSLAVLAAVPPHWQLSGKATVKGTVTGEKGIYAVAIDTTVPELEVTRKWRSDSTESNAGTAKPLTMTSRGTVTIAREVSVDFQHHAEVVEVVREGRSVRNLVLDCTLKQTADRIETFLVTGVGLRVEGSGPLSRFRARTRIDPGPFYKECAFLFGEFDMTGQPLEGEMTVSIDKTWDVQGRMESPELSFSGRSYKNVRVEYDFGLTEEILIRKTFVAVDGGWLDFKGSLGKTREAYEFSGEGVIADLAGADVLPAGWTVPGKVTLGGTATGANDVYDASVEIGCKEVVVRQEGSDAVKGRMGSLQVLTGAKLTFSRTPVTEAAVRASAGEILYEGRTVRNAVIDARFRQVVDRYETLLLTAPGLRLDGSGTRSEVVGKIQFDPAAFQDKLGLLLGENRIGGKPMTGTIETRLANKTRDIKGSLAGPEFVFRKQPHQNVKIDFDLGMGDAIAVRQARASASSGWIEARGTYADDGADLKLNGEGDLARLAGMLSLPEGSKVAGKAVVVGSVAGKDVLQASLAMEIAQLSVQRAEKSILDPAVTIVSEITIDRKAKTMNLSRGELNSTFARGTIGGRILAYDAAAPEIQDFALDLRYVPEKFGPVLGLFVPGDLVGRDEQALSIKVSGKATAAELKGLLGMKLDAYKYQGILVSGPVDGSLEAGILTLKAPLQASGGVVEGIAAVDLRDAKDNPESTFTLAAANVAINEETSKMLERMHPIFHMIEGGGRLTGTAEWDAMLLWKGPLEAGPDAVATAKRSLSGDGRFLVKDLTLQGSLFLGTILQFLGEGTPGQPGEVSVPKWTIQERSGRVAYDDCRVFVQGLDMRFRGYVYFDQKLDMEMDVPVTQRLAAKNPGLDRFLGKTLKVPVKGTVASPQLDFAGAIAGVLKRGILDQIPGPFRDIFGGKDDKK